MQSSLGLDPFTGTYDLYQGNDGYLYRTVPNGISQYNMPANADRLQDIDEPPDTHSINQNGNPITMTSYWQSPTQPVSALYQDFQGTEDLSQLAPDIRLATSRGLDEPSERQVAIVSNDPPFTRLITPSDRYYAASSVHIEGTFPPYTPNSAGYAHPSPSVTPTVPQSAHTTTAGPSEEDEEQDTGHEELPLIKLPFGVWKCGVCDKQLRRKHRAIVHFLNKHGDMRLRCQGRCGFKACNKTFASQDGLDVHLNPVVIECASCGKSLLKKNILRHRSRHCHPEDGITNKEVHLHGPLSHYEPSKSR